MKLKQTKKVSFRVAPSVCEGLELLAQCSETTVADFIRGCLNYALTADGHHLPGFLKNGQDYPGVDDAEGWKEWLEEL